MIIIAIYEIMIKPNIPIFFNFSIFPKNEKSIKSTQTIEKYNLSK